MFINFALGWRSQLCKDVFDKNRPVRDSVVTQQLGAKRLRNEIISRIHKPSLTLLWVLIGRCLSCRPIVIGAVVLL